MEYSSIALGNTEDTQESKLTDWALSTNSLTLTSSAVSLQTVDRCAGTQFQRNSIIYQRRWNKSSIAKEWKIIRNAHSQVSLSNWCLLLKSFQVHVLTNLVIPFHELLQHNTRSGQRLIELQYAMFIFSIRWSCYKNSSVIRRYIMRYLILHEIELYHTTSVLPRDRAVQHAITTLKQYRVVQHAMFILPWDRVTTCDVLLWDRAARGDVQPSVLFRLLYTWRTAQFCLGLSASTPNVHLCRFWRLVIEAWLLVHKRQMNHRANPAMTVIHTNACEVENAGIIRSVQKLFALRVINVSLSVLHQLRTHGHEVSAYFLPSPPLSLSRDLWYDDLWNE